MKKLLHFVLLFSCLLAGISSCSDTDDSKATCTYYVATDSIAYADSANRADYDSLVMHGIVSLQISSYSFTEQSTSNTGQIANAVDGCNVKAINTIQQKTTATPSLNDFRQELFDKNQALFADRNITTPNDIDLRPFCIYITLWNFTYQYEIQKFKIDIE